MPIETIRIVLDITIAIFVLAIVGKAAASLTRLFRTPAETDMDELDGLEFECYCADLLRTDNFKDIRVTKGSGDFGVDILAEKDGITYAIQCKRYSKPVGVKAVQEAYAGRDLYDRMVGVVMTNQFFTAPAVDAAKKLKILLWDGGYLSGMKEE